MLHITKVQPQFTGIITTARRYEKDSKKGSIVVGVKGALKQWQTVVSVGSTVRDISVGDKVMINIDNFAVRKYSKDSIQNDLDNNPVTSYKLDWVIIDDENGNPTECLLISDRDVLYTFEGYEDEDNEEEDEKPSIIIPERKINLN